MSINNKLTDLIPELQYSDKRVEAITLKHLLNHTSGLPDVEGYHWSNHHKSDSSLRNYVLALDLKLESEPGNTYSYSNLAYDILGLVVENISESTFEEYMKEKLLNKHGMTNSDFRYFKIPDALKASPHTKHLITRNVYPLETYPYTREHAPSSTLNASSIELSKWMVSFLQAFTIWTLPMFISKCLNHQMKHILILGWDSNCIPLMITKL